MREDELRRVLFVKAYEEADGDGQRLPPADRAEAARAAMRDVPPTGPVAAAGGSALPADGQRLLVRRADPLLERIRARHPAVTAALASTSRFAAIDAALVVLGALAGFALSALDGTRRIQVLSLPVAGLLAWNIAVYLVLLARALRARSAPRSGLLRGWLARIPAAIVSRLVARSRAFDTGLADALQRFLGAWFEAAAPLYRQRASRAVHLGAVAVGVGLIAGLYLRGTVLDYQATWESTFLDANRVRAILDVVYGPAAWLTGLAIPDAARLEAIRWRGGAGGEPAARWIHLLAATVLLWVVLPRLALALWAASRAALISRRMPLPSSLGDYLRRAFAEVEGVVERPLAMVMPYAYAPGAAALTRLLGWLPSVTAADARIDATDPLPYGEEARFLASLGERGADRARFVVLPFSLATTPEDENHGAVLQGVRDWLAARRPGASVVVVIDEAPYEARLGGASERVAERRELWRRFVRSRGLEPLFTRLAP